MKKDKLIYWITTGIVALVMLFSIYKMYTTDYEHFALPGYLRDELSVFKVVGIIVLLLPQFPVRVKDWAYAGFGITLISASVAHYSSGAGLLRSLDPMIFFVLLAISNFYFHKLQKRVTVSK
ncbi:DoxX family protein [Runella sp.]|uniref:DoxX family protein n=1 Tax=Runella sp. TaxID=1960881 RepID=UPI003D0EB320